MVLHRFRCIFLRFFVFIILSRIIFCVTAESNRSYDFEFLDLAMNDAISFWGVRGASIAFFDKVRNKEMYLQLVVLSPALGIAFSGSLTAMMFHNVPLSFFFFLRIRMVA